MRLLATHVLVFALSVIALRIRSALVKVDRIDAWRFLHALSVSVTLLATCALSLLLSSR